jgi:hypothetical protein
MVSRFSDANPRFIPKISDLKRGVKFEVYDRLHGSYPIALGGYGDVAFAEVGGNLEEVKEECKKLSDYMRSRGIYNE